MNLEERINSLSLVGDELRSDDKLVLDIASNAKLRNGWFTILNSKKALRNISDSMLKHGKLSKWTEGYRISDSFLDKEVAIIMAGNIPAVGFHDLLCALITGFKVQLKLSRKDDVIIPRILDILIKVDKRWGDRIKQVERVSNFDAIIATGSNNTAVSFEHYFSKYPNLIRKNRTSVAILNKGISDNSIDAIGKDILDYFGLGCRNVSKIYIHKDLSLEYLMERWHKSKEIILHHKYKNNYDYNYTLNLLNKVNFLMNGAFLLIPDENLHSRIATVHYEWYQEEFELEKKLDTYENQIQCVVAEDDLMNIKSILPGTTQNPLLNDYADHINTLDFLIKLQ